MRRLRRLLLLSLALPCALAAQTYPTARPVKIIVSGVPGSGGDTIARLLADEFRKGLGGTFVVENKPGAAGRIGTEFAARSAPDGYTLLQTSSGTHSAGPWLTRTPSFDAVKDFTHIARVVTVPFLRVVHPSVPARTAQEFVDHARKSRDLTFGYGSSTSHVAAAALASSAGFNALGVPYKSQPPAITDLVGGRVQFMLADPSVALPHVKAGTLRALAISTAARSALLPEVPTLREAGLRELDTEVWIGIGAPAGLPRDVVDRLNAVVRRMKGSDELQARMRTLGFELTPNDDAEHTAFVQRQHAAWGARIREAGIPAE